MVLGSCMEQEDSGVASSNKDGMALHEAETGTADPAPPAMSATELADKLRSGEITSEAAVEAYLARIEAYDRQGPMVQSIIALNPNALAEARVLDQEAREGSFRGALHGVPVLLKDNIETMELPTTAGSLALKDNMTGRDAPIAAQLRAAGAIILGKTNLSEWANFRSESSISGWSGMGGQTRNPHSLDRNPCGSSSGSGAAVAAMFAPLAVGTETNGSVICPSSMNGIVGFKPTVGLLSQELIVPISSTQDTAGPMTRTVDDAAMMLVVMAGGDAGSAEAERAQVLHSDYLQARDQGLNGVRVGVLRFAQGNMEELKSQFDAALEVLEAQGAVLVDIEEFEIPETMGESEYLVLKTEFKATLNAYLANTAPAVTARSLDELIAFNNMHAGRELVLFDQSILEASALTEDLDGPEYQAALSSILEATRANGIDALLQSHDLDVLVAPANPPAFLIDAVFTDQYPGDRVGAGGPAAIAGYPSLTVPMGQVRGLPVGLGIIGTAWNDAQVLAAGHAYEQASNQIMIPEFAAGPFEVEATADAVRPYSD
jgi:amidase